MRKESQKKEMCSQSRQHLLQMSILCSILSCLLIQLDISNSAIWQPQKWLHLMNLKLRLMLSSFFYGIQNCVDDEDWQKWLSFCELFAIKIHNKKGRNNWKAVCRCLLTNEHTSCRITFIFTVNTIDKIIYLSILSSFRRNFDRLYVFQCLLNLLNQTGTFCQKKEMISTPPYQLFLQCISVFCNKFVFCLSFHQTSLTVVKLFSCSN